MTSNDKEADKHFFRTDAGFSSSDSSDIMPYMHKEEVKEEKREKQPLIDR
ncbi:MAG: hypothetical protein MN733_05370 [Nitrososphaera sp.]|nr:hypothetical protein [Nitrososphaera sp.]